MCDFQCKTTKTKISSRGSPIPQFWLQRGAQGDSLKNDLHTALGPPALTVRLTHYLVLLCGETSYWLPYGAGQEMVGRTLWSLIPILLSIFCLSILLYFCSTGDLILSHLLCLMLEGKACFWKLSGLQIPALPFCLLYRKSLNFSESSFIIYKRATWRHTLQGGDASQMKSCISTNNSCKLTPSLWDEDIQLWAEACYSLQWKGFCAWFQ